MNEKTWSAGEYKETELVGAQVTVQFKERLKAQAAKENRDMAKLVRRALNLYLKLNENNKGE